MIDNFDTIKKQLKELAGVVNEFKSESVQLRIVELLFDQESDSQSDATEEGSSTKTPRKRKSKSTKKNTTKKEATKKSSGRSAGAVATLTSIYDEGFFSKARTIGDIITHCKNLSLIHISEPTRPY